VRRQDPDQLVVAVGRRIAEGRRKKMTQAEFAEAMRMWVQWVSRIENGSNLTFHTLANLLGVRVTELFEPTLGQPTRSRKAAQSLDPDGPWRRRLTRTLGRRRASP
jgi:transcriptional regulator with XRE-family HTH domain